MKMCLSGFILGESSNGAAAISINSPSGIAGGTEDPQCIQKSGMPLVCEVINPERDPVTEEVPLGFSPSVPYLVQDSCYGNMN